MSHGWRCRVGGWVCVGFGLAGSFGGLGCAGMGTPEPDLPAPRMPLPSELPAPEPTSAAPPRSGSLPRSPAAAAAPVPQTGPTAPYQRPGPEAAVSVLSNTPAGGISTPHMPTTVAMTREAPTISVERMPIAATPPAGPITLPSAPATPGDDPRFRPANPAPTAGLSNLVPAERTGGDTAADSSVIWKITQPDNTDMLRDIPDLPGEPVPVVGGSGGVMVPAGPIKLPPPD